MFFYRDVADLDSSAAIIIACPPEILTCLKLRLSTHNVFIIFDSHPRPSYPNGAGTIISTSLEGTARRLTELLPVDLQDTILGNCTSYVFVPRALDLSTPTPWQSVLESSLAQLSMQADMCSQNNFQVIKQKRLEAELKECKERCQRQEKTIQGLMSSRRNAQSHHHPPNPQLRSSPFPTSQQSSSNNPFIVPSRDTATPQATSSRSVAPISQPLGSNNPFTFLNRAATSHTTGSRSVGPSHDPRGSSPPLLNWDDVYASCMQHEFDSEDRALTTERAALRLYAKSHNTSPQSAGPHGIRRGPPVHLDDGSEERLQSHFDIDDRELSAGLIKLSQIIRKVFECGICMEEKPEDSVARPDPCRHAFCRECMREYVSARLEEHRFPILCPTCTVSNGKGKGVTGGARMIFPSLVQMSHGCCRGFTVPCLRPRAHRRAVKHLDRNGDGLIFCAFALSSVRWRLQPACLLTIGTGVSGRCS